MELGNLKQASIADIMTKDLLCYSPEKEKELLEFAQTFHFSFIPNKTRDGILQLKGTEFVKAELSGNMICGADDLLFEQSTLEKFKNGHSHDEVLFVMGNGFIEGVVHIADYNKDFVAIEIFRAIRYFERHLRRHLIDKGHKNKAVLDWIKEKKHLEKNEKNGKTFWLDKHKHHHKQEEREKRKVVSLFSTFYLRILFQFAIEMKWLAASEQQFEDICSLRNWVSHNNEVTTKNLAVDSVYDISGLEKLFKRVESLEYVYAQFEEELPEFPLVL